MACQIAGLQRTSDSDVPRYVSGDRHSWPQIFRVSLCRLPSSLMPGVRNLTYIIFSHIGVPRSPSIRVYICTVCGRLLNFIHNHRRRIPKVAEILIPPPTIAKHSPLQMLLLAFLFFLFSHYWIINNRILSKIECPSRKVNFSPLAYHLNRKY